jgi:hypothetical protein
MFRENEARRRNGTLLTEKRVSEISMKAEPYLRGMYMADGRRLGITQEHGLFCLLLAETQVGDQISIFLGCPVPFVIRPQGDKFAWSAAATFMI